MMILVYAAVGLVLAALLLWLVWRFGKARGWFLANETIYTAKVLQFLGAVGGVIAVTPMEPVLKAVGLGPYTPLVMFAIGVAIEFARKMRTEGGVLGKDLTPKV